MAVSSLFAPDQWLASRCGASPRTAAALRSKCRQPESRKAPNRGHRMAVSWPTRPAHPALRPISWSPLWRGDHATHPLQVTKFAQGSPKFSPDGRWLAYCSNESGKPQVYVQAYPGPGAKIQISGDGGTDPAWRRTGGELFYRNGDRMMAVAVSTAAAFQAGRPQELWHGHYSHGTSSSCGLPGPTSSNYDVTADGRRFLMIQDDQDTISKEVVVVQGWAEEVERLTT